MAKYYLVLTVLMTSLISGCRPEGSDVWIKSSPDQKVDIVFYFNKDTSNNQINHFLNYEIGYPDSEGKGFHSMEGIQSDLSVRNQGYEGYALELRASATDEERQNILKVIRSSPLIFRVFENVVPNGLILDSNYKDPYQEKQTNGAKPKEIIVEQPVQK